jgi:hypothetical protein
MEEIRLTARTSFHQMRLSLPHDFLHFRPSPSSFFNCVYHLLSLPVFALLASRFPSASMAKLPRKSSPRRRSRGPKAPKHSLPLRRSARLAPIIDSSPVEPLDLCSDLVDYEENGTIIHEFRVSVSELARAWMLTGRRFEWAAVSQSLCSDSVLVPAPLEVRLNFNVFHANNLLFLQCNHPVVIKMSRRSLHPCWGNRHSILWALLLS